MIILFFIYMNFWLWFLSHKTPKICIFFSHLLLEGWLGETENMLIMKKVHIYFSSENEEVRFHCCTWQFSEQSTVKKSIFKLFSNFLCPFKSKKGNFFWGLPQVLHSTWKRKKKVSESIISLFWTPRGATMCCVQCVIQILLSYAICI